jgi:hypothetical protein
MEASSSTPLQNVGSVLNRISHMEFSIKLLGSCTLSYSGADLPELSVLPVLQRLLPSVGFLHRSFCSCFLISDHTAYSNGWAHLYLPFVTHIIFFLASLMYTLCQCGPSQGQYKYSSPCSYWFSLDSFTGLYQNYIFLRQLAFLAGCLLSLLFNPEYGDSSFLWNASELSDYIVSHPRR